MYFQQQKHINSLWHITLISIAPNKCKSNTQTVLYFWSDVFPPITWSSWIGVFLDNQKRTVPPVTKA